MATDAGAVSAIVTAAAARGFSADQVTDFLAALDDAGYEVSTVSGGTPAEIIDTVGVTRKRVAGTTGLYLLTIDLGGGDVKTVLERISGDEISLTQLV